MDKHVTLPARLVDKSEQTLGLVWQTLGSMTAALAGSADARPQLLCPQHPAAPAAQRSSAASRGWQREHVRPPSYFLCCGITLVKKQELSVEKTVSKLWSCRPVLSLQEHPQQLTDCHRLSSLPGPSHLQTQGQ